MEDFEKKAAEWLEAYNTAPRLNIEEVYIKAQLSISESQVMNDYRDILERHIVHYAPKWLVESPELNKTNTIKYIASILVKCREHHVVGDLRNYLSTLFSPSMNYCYRLKENGYEMGPKSNQFHDILFELYILEFYLDRKYEIDLDKVALSNGRNAEFWVQDESRGFYVEAKNIPENDLYQIIYGNWPSQNSSIGRFNLSEEQERKIRERFKSQYKNALSKFKNTSEMHAIFINLNFPLGLLGEKLQTYINKMLNSKHSESLIAIGIFCSNKRFYYNCLEHSLETMEI